MKALLLLLPLVLLLTSCSVLKRRTLYLVSNSQAEIYPICTRWDSSNGAALISVEGAHLVVSPGEASRVISLGPILIPLIPIHPFDRSMEAALEIQVVPAPGTELRLPLKNLVLKYDGEVTPLRFGYLRIKGDVNGEVTAGQLEGDQLASELKISKPYHLSLFGNRMKAPEMIEVSLVLKSGEQRRNVSVLFKKDDRTKYFPFLIPDVESPDRCETDLPGVGKARYFF